MQRYYARHNEAFPGGTRTEISRYKRIVYCFLVRELAVCHVYVHFSLTFPGGIRAEIGKAIFFVLRVFASPINLSGTFYYGLCEINPSYCLSCVLII